MGAGQQLMYARVIRPQQRPQPRLAQGKTFSAPTGGWVSNRALANPSAPGIKQGAAILDDFFPRASTVKLRRGKERYAALEDDTADVTALFSYRNGGNKVLFGANDSTIYNLTTVTDTDTTGLSVMTDLTGGDWVVVQFATTGGVFLIGVNGEDDGLIYDGTDFWPNKAGGVKRLNYTARTVAFPAGATVTGGSSGATGIVCGQKSTGASTGSLYLRNVTGTFTNGEALTGSPSGAATASGTALILSNGITFGSSGLTVKDMSFVFVYRNRLWFIHKDSLSAWYMDDADVIGGTAVEFPMAGIFRRGGSLMFGQGWSFQTGAMGGLSEQCVFASSEGEVAIFQGDYPGTAETWNEVGLYQIGRPLGKRAFLRGGGDLAIATSVGLVPLSKAISLDVTSLAVATVSYNIADAWSDAVNFRGLTGWECQLWPELKMAVVSPPNIIGAGTPVLFIANTETGAWCRFRNWRAICMEVFDGQLYFGSENGLVFKANQTGQDDGATYTGSVVPLYEDMGTPSAIKLGQVIRAVSRSTVAFNQQCSILYDFDDELPQPPLVSPAIDNNSWGSGTWDSSAWGLETPSVINQGWQSASGYGYALAPAYQVTSGSVIPLDDELIRLEITYSTGDLVT